MATPFGEYFLLEKIAAGGMAEIHKAEIRGLGGFKREVAIKRILPEHTSDSRFVEMLLDEARIAARLQHPNIAQVIQCGCIDNTYFIVMELVDGVALSKILGFLSRHEERLSSGAAVFAAMGLLRALDHAHKAKADDGSPLHIVHRDVSPHNVLLSTHGDVKLIDFGVAHAADRLHKSETGVLKGKLTYMAPEQVEAKVLDARTDQYAAGLVTVEMLTGKRVFGGQSEIDVIKAVLDGRTDDIGAQLKIGQVLDSIASACMKAVSKDPNDRFVDCEAFANALLAAFPVDVEAAKSELAKVVARVRAEPPRNVFDADTEAPTKRVTPTKPSVTVSETLVLRAPAPAKPARRWVWPAGAAVLIGAGALTLWASAGPGPKDSPPGGGALVSSVTASTAPVPTASTAPVPTASTAPVPTASTAPVPTASTAPVPTASTAPVPVASPPTTRQAGAKQGKPESSGAVDVACLPWCDITIDGKSGLHSPLRNHALSVGNHVVEVVNPPSGKSDKKIVEIRSGETAKIGFRLE